MSKRGSLTPPVVARIAAPRVKRKAASAAEIVVAAVAAPARCSAQPVHPAARPARFRSNPAARSRSIARIVSRVSAAAAVALAGKLTSRIASRVRPHWTDTGDLASFFPSGTCRCSSHRRMITFACQTGSRCYYTAGTLRGLRSSPRQG